MQPSSHGANRMERETELSSDSTTEMMDCMELYLRPPIRLHGMMFKQFCLINVELKLHF
jgi:hypothetical protein